MIKGIYTAASGMVSLQLKNEVITNNIANVNTTGFKREGVFRKTLIDKVKILKMNSGDFVNLDEVDEVRIDFKQGNLYSTGNPLDTAIDGKGFFSVQTPNGIRYTRNGSFTIDNERYLTTTNGYRLLGQNGPIQINGQNVFIGDDGSIIVDGQIVENLRIMDFPEPYVMNKIGDGLFEADETQAIPARNFKIKQGFLEESNVNAVKEMVDLIELSRDYDSNQRTITIQDSTLDKAVNEVGRITR
ncbi:flagellar basal-body rod protein FlgF [candidate division KSB1 bacterium]|nr:MAG: flagellar basal-body rod protein FlgF [candidate division KSB1 bacterium]